MASFILVAVFTGCTSSEKKVEKAEENVADTKMELQDDQAKAAQAKAQDEFIKEWESYKMESEWTIRKNDSAIVILKATEKKNAQKKDAEYDKKIAMLEEKNEALKKKLTAYDRNKENWNNFKTEFSHDMNELGQAFKGLVTKSK